MQNAERCNRKIKRICILHSMERLIPNGNKSITSKLKAGGALGQSIMQIAIAAKSLGRRSRFHMVMPLMQRSRINRHMGCPWNYTFPHKIRNALKNIVTIILYNRVTFPILTLSVSYASLYLVKNKRDLSQANYSLIIKYRLFFPQLIIRHRSPTLQIKNIYCISLCVNIPVDSIL